MVAAKTIAFIVRLAIAIITLLTGVFLAVGAFLLCYYGKSGAWQLLIAAVAFVAWATAIATNSRIPPPQLSQLVRSLKEK